MLRNWRFAGRNCRLAGAVIIQETSKAHQREKRNEKIRELYAEGMTQKEVAEEVGVDQSQVSRAVCNERTNVQE